MAGLGVFERQTEKPIDEIDANDIQEFMLWARQNRDRKTYGNYLCVFKALFRDYLKQPELVSDYKFPSIVFKPKTIPSKDEIRVFYNALPELKYKTIFLVLASSGLRISELLTSKIDYKNRMLTPASHSGTNKKSWFSFYNNETAEMMELSDCKSFTLSRNTITHTFKDTANLTGIEITPQTLRAVFAREMSLKGVQDRYVDAFCGRVPQSVLARHYSDYSPEVLKEIYERADIRILE